MGVKITLIGGNLKNRTKFYNIGHPFFHFISFCTRTASPPGIL